MQQKAVTTLRNILTSIYDANKVLEPSAPVQDVERVASVQGACLQYAPPELLERVNAVVSDFAIGIGFYAHKSNTEDALTVLEAHMAQFYNYVATISPRSPSPIVANSVTALQDRQNKPNLAAAFITFRLRITS